MGNLYQDSGSSPQQRTEEALRIYQMCYMLPYDQLIPKDQKFWREIREKLQQYGQATIISPKVLFWMRDIKEKLLG